MEEYFKQNSVKPRMMMGVLNIAIHNSSYKGHKPLRPNKSPPCRRRRDRMDLQLPIQSVPITIKVSSSNLVHGEVYSMQHQFFSKFIMNKTCNFQSKVTYIKITNTLIFSIKKKVTERVI